MAELDLGPPPSNGPGKGLAIAGIAMVVIAAGAYFFTDRGTMKLTVSHEGLLAPHIEDKAMSGGGIKVVGVGGSSEDVLYITADLHIENLRSEPLFITGSTATMTLPDGSVADATVVAPPDFDRVEPSFPALTPLLQHPLAMDAIVPGKGTLDGTVLLLFPGETEATWKAKKAATLTLTLAHGEPQTVALP